MIENYDYHLPPQLIANSPASPRDAARLFVYDTASNEVVLDVFRNLATHLPKKSLLVFNNTKVVPARLWLKKESGGKIQVLLAMNEFRPGDELLKGVVDRKIAPGAKLFFRSGGHLEVVKQEEQFFFFRPHLSKGSLWTQLEHEGVTPIPPYIKGSTLSEHALREKYQSILAKHPASIAAPTASLHFTKRLLSKLAKENIARTEVTLHVGAGTFAPIDETNFKSKKLFTEYLEVTAKSAHTINSAIAHETPIIPVGTTAMRTIESAAAVRGVRACEKPTNIFIFPPYRFKVADGLITNFHVPRSSLMLLVDALLQHKHAKRRILDLYKIAIKEKFRFYSFGDGMLIK